MTRMEMSISARKSCRTEFLANTALNALVPNALLLPPEQMFVMNAFPTTKQMTPSSEKSTQLTVMLTLASVMSPNSSAIRSSKLAKAVF